MYKNIDINIKKIPQITHFAKENLYMLVYSHTITNTENVYN